MTIETVDDLGNQIADWLGIYGCCKSAAEGKDECDNDNPFCCRVGFMMKITERIRQAVSNENKLQDVGFK